MIHHVFKFSQSGQAGECGMYIGNKYFEPSLHFSVFTQKKSSQLRHTNELLPDMNCHVQAELL